MTVDFPYRDTDIVSYFQADSDVLSFEAKSDTLFVVTVRLNDSPSDLPPIDLYVSTGLNDTMVIVMRLIDSDSVGAGLQAVSNIAVVGVTEFGDGHALRFSMFKEYSDAMALINGFQAMVLAYYNYIRAGGQ